LQRGVDVDGAFDFLDAGDLRDPAAQVVDASDPIGRQRRAVLILDDHAEIRLALARELLQEVVSAARFGARRQHPDVTVGDADLQEW